MADKIEQRSVSVRIDGKEIVNSLKAITNEATALRKELLNMEEGTDSYVRKSVALEQANEAARKNRAAVRAIADAWQAMPAEVQKSVTEQQAKIGSLSKEYEKLKKAAGDVHTPEMVEIKAQIDALNKSVKVTVDQFINLKKEAAQGSWKRTEADIQEVTAALKAATKGSAEYLAAQKKLNGLNKDLEAHKAGLKEVEGAWYKNIPAIQGFAAAAVGVWAIDKVVSYGAELGQLTIKTDALARKSTVVLGDELGRVTDEAEKNAKAMGLTTSAYIAQTAGIADLLIPMGFQRKEAADMSVQLENLSGAMSEWSGGQHTAEDASKTLSKALLGEREELKAYGIAISEEDVKQRLLSKGMSELTGQRLAQAKAIATMELILEKSTDAQTAFATGQDSLIRQQALLKARIEEISEKLAKIFLPVLAALGAAFNAVLTPIEAVVEKLNAFSRPVEATAEAFKSQKNSVKNLEEGIKPLLSRYDELAAKSNKTTAEQTELRDIAKKVGEVIPIAATSFGKYGEALSLNTTIAKSFIETEKVRLQYLNQAAIIEETNHIFRMQAMADELAMQLQTKQTSRIVDTDTMQSVEQDLNNAQMQETQKAMLSIQKSIDGANAQLKFLKGETSNLPKSALVPTTKDPISTNDDAALKAEKTKLEKFKELKIGYEADIRKLTDDSHKEETAIIEKFDKEIFEYKKITHSKDAAHAREAAGIIIELEKYKNRELLALYQKQLRDVEDQAKVFDEEAANRLKSKEDQEVSSINKKYKKAIDEAIALENDTQKATEGQRAKAHALRLHLEETRETEINNMKARLRFEQEAKDAAATNDFVKLMEHQRDEIFALLNQKPVTANLDLKLEENLQSRKVALEKAAKEEIAIEEKKYNTLIKGLGDDTENVKKLEEKKAEIVKAINTKSAADILKIEKDSNTKRIAAQRELASSIGDIIVTMGDLIAGETAKNSDIQKIAAIAKLAIDSASAISSAVAWAAETSPDPITLAVRIASTTAIVLGNIANARNILNAAPQVKQHFDGGEVIGAQDGKSYRPKYYGEAKTGYYADPSLFMTSEKGGEYVIAYPETRDPIVANFLPYIEATRQRRVRGFADGGSPQPPEGGLSPSVSVPSGFGGQSMVTIPVAMFERFMSMTEGMKSAFDRGIIISYEDVEHMDKMLRTLKTDRGYS